MDINQVKKGMVYMLLLIILGISAAAILATNAAIVNKPVSVPVKVRRK